MNSRSAQSVMLVSTLSMKKVIHFLAISIFALIQLCAPLVHAHIDGIQSSAAIHIHGVPHSFSSASLSQCHVEAYESPAISIPHQNQNDRGLLIPALCASSAHPISSTTISLTLAPNPSSFRSSAYYRPHTQAPPLRS